MVFNKFIISRTDGIGDVILALPVAGALKEIYPDCKIVFLGRTYTQDIIKSCKHIYQFVSWDDLLQKTTTEKIKIIKDINADVIIHVFPEKAISKLAKNAGIPFRIGTSSRAYHWLTCNHLVKLHRKNSPYHESQLNLKLLQPLGGKAIYDITEIPGFYGFSKIPSLDNKFAELPDRNKFNLILHPKSKGSAREWGLNNFKKLIEILPANRFKLFVTGTEEEGKAIRPALIAPFPEVVDLTGRLTIVQLISFIANIDGILAASTGPLHIAAALNKYVIGLYAPMRPIHPGRWAPLGLNASYLVKEKKCNNCRNKKRCECIESIAPEEVAEKLMKHVSLSASAKIS